MDVNMLFNFHSRKLLFDDFSYQKEIKDNEYIINIDNLKTNDEHEFIHVSKPNQILLNAINYRIENLNEQIVDQNNNTVKNQKLKDMIIILQIHKNNIELNSNYEDILNSMRNNLNDKLVWIKKRLENNQKKQLKLLENYEYYKKHINGEISNKSETKKLLKVKHKMNDYFTTEINTVENRIELLSGKLSMLQYFQETNPDVITKDNKSSFLNEYIKAFIDKKNEGDLNEILLCLNFSDGAYYDKIRMKKRENPTISNCVNTKLICEINAFIKA